MSIKAKIPHSRVAIIGTGFSGLGMAIELRKSGEEDFVVLEKEAGVGGTWRVNHYPGCACDVESHLYSFSFEPNPNWTRMFAPQPEIKTYLEGCANKYRLNSKIKFNSAVSQARWNEAEARWELTLEDGRQRTADVVISGMGGLSTPSLPNIPGREDFAGHQFHSQQWDHDYDLRGKRVAVIGTGASAIQFVPQIQPDVAELKLFQRTPPWILPKPDRAISRLERGVFRRVPALQDAARNTIYWLYEARAAGFVINPRVLKVAERWARSHLRKQVKDRALRAQLTPDYDIGCKRILISNDYYPALCQDNVAVISDGISRITETGIVTADGVEHPVDVIIYGTGFKATDPVPRGAVFGRQGQDLIDAWSDGPSAYKGCSVKGFPNLFFLMGPNTGLAHNSMVYMIESQIRYVLGALKTMRRNEVDAIEIRAAEQDRYNQQVQAQSANTVWNTGGCTSWYLHPETGRNVTLWPGFTWDFRLRTRRFDANAYHLRKKPRHAPVLKTDSTSSEASAA